MFLVPTPKSAYGQHTTDHTSKYFSGYALNVVRVRVCVHTRSQVQ